MAVVENISHKKRTAHQKNTGKRRCTLTNHTLQAAANFLNPALLAENPYYNRETTKDSVQPGLHHEPCGHDEAFFLAAVLILASMIELSFILLIVFP
jgi:hypothetical protein